MTTLSAVRPLSVAPLLLPGPHGDGSVPKLLPDAEGVAVVVVAPLLPAAVLGELPRSELHAPAANASTSAAPLRARHLLLPTTSPLWSGAGGHPSQNLTSRHKRP